MEETKKFPSLPQNFVSLQKLQEQRLREQQQKLKEKQQEQQERRLNEKEEPSLPPNFISLQKLQEQRLKEQQQKLKEKQEEEEKRLKEEEERRLEEQRLKEEREKQQEEEEERKLRDLRNISGRKIAKTSSNRFFRDKRSNFLENKRWMKPEIDSLEPKLEIIEVQSADLEQNTIDQSKKKKWKKKKKKKNKNKNKESKDDGTLTENLNALPPSEIPPLVSPARKKIRGGFRSRTKNQSEENGGDSLNPTVEIVTNGVLVVVSDDEKKVESEVDDEEKSTADKQRRRRKKPSHENGKVFRNPTVEMVRRIRDISIGDDKKKVEMNGDIRMRGYRSPFGHSDFMGARRRFGFGYQGKPRRDSNLKWVKKEEINEEKPTFS